MQNYVLFEDEKHVNFLPLVYFRPVWELRCGAVSLAEKFYHLLPGKYYFIARDYLQKYYLPVNSAIGSIKTDDAVLFLNGRWVMGQNDPGKLSDIAEGEALFSGDTALAFRVRLNNLNRYVKNGVVNNSLIAGELKRKETNGKVASFLWDLIDWNGDELIADYNRQNDDTSGMEMKFPGVHILAAENVRMASGVEIRPGVVIDAENGPVWIDEDAVIMANAVLEGPIYIGKKSRIKIGAKLYENTAVGPVCKIGGEVEGSIIQGYSNKQHDGFLGHAYLGSWVNLGADTNNSDLKNNYGMIRVLLNGKPVNTGKRFLGLMMGDHSKTAINTMFNTGTIVGVNCNIFGAGMLPKFVPSFSWGGAEGMTDFILDKAIHIAKNVMARRNVEFTDRDEQLFQEVRRYSSKIEKSILV